mgnify:CR=1 FL=1
MKYFIIAFIFIGLSAFDRPNEVIKFSVSFEHWESCEIGQDCPTLVVERNSIQDSVLFVMPCGGTSTSVQLWSSESTEYEPIQSVTARHDDCPPTFNLTGLPDGMYNAHMWACGLGGGISFEIVTKE